MHPAAGLPLAYLAGSIPAAYIAGKAKGVDLRQHGSGNLGATNVVRVLGKGIGITVFAFDVAKGALPVFYFPRLFPSLHPEYWAIAYGIAAILGHVRPVFLLGRGGGKGVATASGVFLGLAPLPLLVSFAVFVTTLKLTGYVSLGSLLGAVALPLALLFTVGAKSPVFWVSVLLSAFVFYTHRANIGRLRRGEEHRFGKKKSDAPSTPVAGGGGATGAGP